MSDPTWHPTVPIDSLEDGLPTGTVLPSGETVCLIRRGEGVWAVEDRCPHRAFALSGGECPGDVDGAPIVECPWHGARFACADGRVLTGPATDGIATYPVRLEHGVVLVCAAPTPAPSPEVA